MKFELTSVGEIPDLCLKILENFKGYKIFFLIGDLGSGKTTFTNCFIKILGSIENAQSPTFILHREYELKEGIKAQHIDLYRVENEIELAELRLEKLRTSEDYVIIEWADKFEEVLKDIFSKSNILKILFELGDKNSRIVTISQIENEDSGD